MRAIAGARDLFRLVAYYVNMPVTVVGRVVRLALICLAEMPARDRDRLLARYRLRGRGVGWWR